MKWETLESREDFSKLLTNEDEVKRVQSVEVMFDDGAPTSVLVELKNGRFISFASAKTSHDGCRENLFVCVTQEEDV